MPDWHLFAIAGTVASCLTVAVVSLRPSPHHLSHGPVDSGSFSGTTSFNAKTSASTRPKVCASPQPDTAEFSQDAVVRAHQVMQRHRACRVGSCPEKSAAFEMLVAAGRIVPDSCRSRIH